MGEKKILLLEARAMIAPSTLDAKFLPSDRQSFDYVQMVDEDCIVKLGDEEVEAEAGDIVIKFYESDFPHRFVVVKNEEWKENLLKYRELEQKRKEEWAKKHSSNDCICEACDCCEACSPSIN